MEMKGERQVPVSRDKAWEALNDPDVLGACIPGCESMEQVGEDEFKAKVRAAVGPVNARFNGKVKLSDVKPPESYRMSFKGDGTAGFAQGTADVHLAAAESGDGTTVSYEAEAKVGGKLAQIGSRLVDGAARKMADEFFTNLTTHMGGAPAEQAEAEAGQSEKAGPKEEAPETSEAETGEARGEKTETTAAPASGSGGGGFMAMLRNLLAKLFGKG